MDWRDNFKSSLRRLKRIIFIRWGRIMRSTSNNTKLKRPQKLSKSEDTALQIFLEILHDTDSKLYYDITTQECYISSPNKEIFIFLESRNVKIINSVFGYDVHISGDLEHYMSEKFIKEMAIRRNSFKNDVLSRINHSLDSTLDKIRKKNGNR
jgi:hypothetical protein